MEQYPVLTFASGPTNSMRGAAYLSDAKDAVVVDIGGTTTDIGVLTNGFPRESAIASDVAASGPISACPTSPRSASAAAVRIHVGEPLTVGPDSVGYRLSEQSLVFGGETLTATDIAVAAGQADIGERSRLDGLDSAVVDAVIDAMHATIEVGVDRMKTSAEPVPLILVGGGAILVSRPIAGTDRVITPEHAAVANAIGAAIAQIGGEIDRIFSYGGAWS